MEREAKERQKAHGKTAPGRKKTLPANLPEVNGDARDQAAAEGKFKAVASGARAGGKGAGIPLGWWPR